MTHHASNANLVRSGRLVERLLDRVGLLMLLALGVSTAGATVLVGL